MASPLLDRVLAFTQAAEGGVMSSERASELGDPGGETRFGITSQTGARMGMSEAEFRGIGPDEARDIFVADYWGSVRGDAVGRSHPAVAAALFDFGVQSGPTLAIKQLQRVLGLKRTGHLDDSTLSALRNRDDLETARTIGKARSAFLDRWIAKDPSKRDKWRNGFDRRLSDLDALFTEVTSHPPPSAAAPAPAYSRGEHSIIPDMDIQLSVPSERDRPTPRGPSPGFRPATEGPPQSPQAAAPQPVEGGRQFIQGQSPMDPKPAMAAASTGLRKFGGFVEELGQGNEPRGIPGARFAQSLGRGIQTAGDILEPPEEGDMAGEALELGAIVFPPAKIARLRKMSRVRQWREGVGGRIEAVIDVRDQTITAPLTYDAASKTVRIRNIVRTTTGSRTGKKAAGKDLSKPEVESLLLRAKERFPDAEWVDGVKTGPDQASPGRLQRIRLPELGE